MEAIKINKICKNYKKVKALDNLSFSINEGSLFGLLGLNGAGKTTLIKILSGLIKKDSGEAYVMGYSLDKDLSKIKDIINVSPQETSIALNLTVEENLKFFANVYNKNSSTKIKEIIKDFSLEEVLKKKAKTLSGGWQRRLSLAIALISEPKVLFLDEPTLGLDVIARRELWKIILSLKGKITIVLTSHYLEEIAALCDDVAIISKGKLIKKGTIEEINKQTHCNSFEDSFISLIEGDK